MCVGIGLQSCKSPIEEEPETIEWQVVSGEYRYYTNDSANSGAAPGYYFPTETEHTTFTANVRKEEGPLGDGYGIVLLNSADTSQYVMFVISDNGTYKIVNAFASTIDESEWISFSSSKGTGLGITHEIKATVDTGVFTISFDDGDDIDPEITIDDSVGLVPGFLASTSSPSLDNPYDYYFSYTTPSIP